LTHSRLRPRSKNVRSTSTRPPWAPAGLLTRRIRRRETRETVAAVRNRRTRMTPRTTTRRRIRSTGSRVSEPRAFPISRRRASCRSRRLPGLAPRGTKSLSPRSAAIRAETENGMATRIQAAFRGMRARRRVDALLSSSER
jgi:hypothetical protein